MAVRQRAVRMAAGLPYGWAWLISQVMVILIVTVVLLVMLAFLLLADRKVWAAVQMRRGPNVVGPFGLLQWFADLIKFVVKEIIVPAGANKGVFFLAPILSAMLAIAAWAVVPFDDGWVIADINVGILYLFAHFVDGRVRHHHGRLGVEFEIRLPRLACARPRRW